MFILKCLIPPPQGQLEGDSVWIHGHQRIVPHICTELMIAREQTIAYISSMLVCCSMVAPISQQALWQDTFMWCSLCLHIHQRDRTRGGKWTMFHLSNSFVGSDLCSHVSCRWRQGLFGCYWFTGSCGSLVHWFMWFSGSWGSVVHVVHWFMWFTGSCGSLVHWFIWFAGSTGSMVHWFIWFTGSCSSLVHEVHWFMWFTGSSGSLLDVVHWLRMFTCSGDSSCIVH